MNLPLLFLLLIPVVAIAFILTGRFPAKPVAVAAALLNFAFSIGLLCAYQVNGTGYQFMTDLPWVNWPGVFEIRFHLGIDGLNLPMVLLATTVTLAAVWVSPAKIRRGKEFYSYLLAISLGAIGAFISLDLFFLYVFHEFALIPTFLLIGIWGFQGRQFASTQQTIYLAFGSFVFLAGILGIVFAAPTQGHTFDLVALTEALNKHPLSLAMQSKVYVLLLVGFGILVALFPFHTWAPPGYAAAPPAAAMLHAGVLKNFGLYALLRLTPVVIPGAAYSPSIQTLLTVLLLGNIVYIGLVTLVQKELQLMLGFSSVMHMGYLFLGLLAFNQTSLSGLVLLMVGHGLCSALLFGLAGEIQQRCGENRLSELGGLSQKMPVLGALFILGSLASIGIPGFANFPGELLIFFGAWKESFRVATILALWGVVIYSTYQLRAVRRVFFGELPEKFAHVKDLEGVYERAPYVLLAAALLLLGFYPGLLLRIIQPSLNLLIPA